MIEEQSGVVSRAQLCAAGMPPQYGRDRVRAGAWQHLHAGVYLTHTGPTSYLARCWAALLAVDGSVLAGVTAAYLHRIRERQPSDVHVLVPYSRQAYAILPGVVVRRTRRPIQFEGSPPRTPLAATALDLVGQTRREDEVVGWITAASRRFGGLRQLREEEKNRRKLRHRELVEDLLGAGSEGLESPLEVRCDRKVLIPHGLPEFERQARGAWMVGRFVPIFAIGATEPGSSWTAGPTSTRLTTTCGETTPS